jgi:hypothetical protein
MDAPNAATERAAEADTGLKTTDAELETIRQQLAEETKKREAAEQERDQDRQRLLSERSNRFVAQEAAVATALEASQARLAELKRIYVERMGGGKFEEGVELQEQIADAAQEVRALAWQKQQFDHARRQPPKDEPGTRFEEAIASLPEGARAWCRQHPEYVTDKRKNAEAQAAHFAALSDGVREWSPEYWEFVEGRLGLSGPSTDSGAADGFEELDDGRDASGRRRIEGARRTGATTAAPPSRGGTSGTGEPRRRTRQPTAGELEAAKISFPEEWKESPKKALELYFENQTALKREGRL